MFSWKNVGVTVMFVSAILIVLSVTGVGLYGLYLDTQIGMATSQKAGK